MEGQTSKYVYVLSCQLRFAFWSVASDNFKVMHVLNGESRPPPPAPSIDTWRTCTQPAILMTVMHILWMCVCDIGAADNSSRLRKPCSMPAIERRVLNNCIQFMGFYTGDDGQKLFPNDALTLYRKHLLQNFIYFWCFKNFHWNILPFG